MNPFFLSLFALASSALALSVPSHFRDAESNLMPRADCENTATSRSCWGNYSVDTDYYTTWPDTGVTKEYWLTVEEAPCSPDGVEVSTCLTFNGSIPGPTISADWGDNLVIHVTNNMTTNGTAIHWHGLRQLNSTIMDGVPGVTQCPIAPGDSLTYSFQATQYGSTWYHSHFSLQYGEGLFGPLILNGPATADYDEDLGVLFLQDWSHTPVFELWDSARAGAPPTLDTGLVNGTNTYNSSGTITGKKYETVFESGTKYRIRIVNVAVEGHFQFSIDGHTLTVIANDLVPIVPYTTDSVVLTMGQRYDLIVEANAVPGNYWLRAGWIDACATNANPEGMTGIVRYAASNSSTANPTSTSNVTATTSCNDEPYESLVPWVALDVTNIQLPDYEETLSFELDTYFKWTLNSSSFYIDWEDPTLEEILEGNDTFPSDYNVLSVESSGSSAKEWVVLVIEDASGVGVYHPIHLHGHDFWVLGQSAGVFDAATTVLNTTNPPRRDVATLPANGFLAIAFQLDNPGVWLTHCHIAWHASEGFSLQWIESQSSISSVVDSTDLATAESLCSRWDSYYPTEEYPQSDSGI